MALVGRERRAFALTDFPFHSFDKLRYGDTDRQGHVNNAVFPTFLETGRVEFLFDHLLPLLAPDTSFVIADLSLQFVAEVTWPGQVEIGTGVTRVGRSSMGLYQHVYQGETLVATADTVIVQVNDQTGKSHPMTAEAQAFLKEHLLP